MAQLIGVKLSRFDASPWGFRLQGGKDFGAPLLIQKVRRRFSIYYYCTSLSQLLFLTRYDHSNVVRRCIAIDKIFSTPHNTAVTVTYRQFLLVVIIKNQNNYLHSETSQVPGQR
jgi:hypothetical protein